MPSATRTIAITGHRPAKLGGTANAIRYATGKLPIINLWPQWISQKETL